MSCKDVHDSRGRPHKVNPTTRAFSSWRAFRPVQAVEASYKALADYNNPAMFFTLRAKAEALAAAAALENEGNAGKPLYGLPANSRLPGLLLHAGRVSLCGEEA